jgi:hypothetical protein
MTPEEERFTAAFKVFETQVAEATQFWFAASTINEVAKADPDTLKALNKTPSFWVTVRVALEYQGIIAAGKIFGNRSANPHNIDSFFEVLRASSAEVFSAAALAARKRQGSANADEWLPDFMKRVYVPTLDDIGALYKLAKPHRKVYEAQWAAVRNRHVAHTEVVDYDARSEIFAKTRIPDFENLISFLNQLYDAIWHLYYNGTKPAIDPTTHSVASLVARDLRELRAGKNDEHIVAETRKCMTLLTQGGGSTAAV